MPDSVIASNKGTWEDCRMEELGLWSSVGAGVCVVPILSQHHCIPVVKRAKMKTI